MNTSNATKLLAAVLAITLLFSACKDDDFNALTDLNGTQTDIRNMLTSEDITQRETIPSDAFRFVSQAGAVITAKPNSFVKTDGSLYNGNIDFEFSEMYTKSEILLYGIQTLALGGQIIESDGEFNITASENGNRLRLATNKNLTLQVPTENPNELMELFLGVEDRWSPFVDGNPLQITEVDSMGLVYETLLGQMDWVNIDYFTKFDGLLTEVKLEFPEGYTVNNTTTYAVFTDRDIVLTMNNYNDENFSASLPIGESVHFIVIAALDDSTFRYAEEENEIEANLVVNLEPESKSAEDIKKCIKELD